MPHTARVVAIVVLLVVIVIFGIYRRKQRAIRFQKLVKARILTQLTLWAIIGFVFLAAGFSSPMVYIFDAIGIVLGIGVAYLAIRTTSFEPRKDSWFYRPNPWIHMLSIVVFIGRFAYILYQDYKLAIETAAGNGQPTNQVLSAYTHDPYTTTILFVLITYYTGYYMFLIRKTRHLEIEKQ
ncbi:hypothetical protein, partial [Alicyclobacillus acidiphilus]